MCNAFFLELIWTVVSVLKLYLSKPTLSVHLLICLYRYFQKPLFRSKIHELIDKLYLNMRIFTQPSPI